MIIYLEIILPAVFTLFVGIDIGQRIESRRLLRVLTDPVLFPKTHVIPTPFPYNEAEARLYDQDAQS